MICPGGVGFETRSASGGQGAVLVEKLTRPVIDGAAQSLLRWEQSGQCESLCGRGGNAFDLCVLFILFILFDMIVLCDMLTSI